jgi:hypothetical protein
MDPDFAPLKAADSAQVWKHNVASGTWTHVTPAGITRAFSGVSVDPNNAKRVIVSTIDTRRRPRRDSHA